MVMHHLPIGQACFTLKEAWFGTHGAPLELGRHVLLDHLVPPVKAPHELLKPVEILQVLQGLLE